MDTFGKWEVGNGRRKRVSERTVRGRGVGMVAIRYVGRARQADFNGETNRTETGEGGGTTNNATSGRNSAE